MDLTPTAEERAFRADVRRWLGANVPRDDLKTLDERKAWHRKLYEAGYVGMLWPTEYRGWGRPPMQQAIAQDQIAHPSPPPPIHRPRLRVNDPTIIAHRTHRP